MGNVTVFTKTRELAIENGTVVSGKVDGNGHLILTKKDASTVDAGVVVGAKGDTGAAGQGLVSVAIPVSSDLNTYLTAGVFTQISNANAAAGSNYPAPYAGLLEVATSPSGTGQVIWQRYTLYNNSAMPATVWLRATNGATGASAWSTWVCANAPKFVSTSVCDTALALTTTATDLSATSITLTSLGTSDNFMVTASVDLQSTGTTATTGVVRLVVDSTVQTAQINWNNGAVTALRDTASQQWLVSGLSAGTHTVKLSALRSGGADAMIKINAVHTTLLAVRL